MDFAGNPVPILNSAVITIFELEGQVLPAGGCAPGRAAAASARHGGE